MLCPKCKKDTATKNKENYKVQIEGSKFGNDLVAKNVEVNRCLFCENVWVDLENYKKVVFEAVSQAWLDDTWFWEEKELKNHEAVNVIVAMGKDALPWLIKKCASQPYHWDIILQKIIHNDGNGEYLSPKIISSTGKTKSDLYTKCCIWIRWGIKYNIVPAKLSNAHPEIIRVMDQLADRRNFTDILFEFTLVGENHYVNSKSLYKWAGIYDHDGMPSEIRKFGKTLKRKIKMLAQPPETDETCLFNYPSKNKGKKNYVAVRKNSDDENKVWINLQHFILYVRYGAAKAAKHDENLKKIYLKVARSLKQILEMSKNEKDIADE